MPAKRRKSSKKKVAVSREPTTPVEDESEVAETAAHFPLHRLPLEIIHLIWDNAHSIGDLYALYDSSASIRRTITPHAFKHVRVAGSMTDAVAFYRMASSKPFIGAVQDLLLDYNEGGRIVITYTKHNPPRVRRRDATQVISSALQAAFVNLNHASRLRSLSLDFRDDPFDWEPRDSDPDSHPDAMQEDILIALTLCPPPALTSLELRNICAYPWPGLRRLAPLMGALTFLSIHALFDTFSNKDQVRQDLTDFWDMVPEAFLEPTQDTLQSLSIACNFPLGYFPPSMSLEDLYFPHLRELELEGVAFGVQFQEDYLQLTEDDDEEDEIVWFEDFIADHGESLRRLSLSSCYIECSSATAPPGEVSWKSVYDFLNEELPYLTDLSVDPSCAYRMPNFTRPEWEDDAMYQGFKTADAKAFSQLMRAVRQRKLQGSPT